MSLLIPAAFVKFLYHFHVKRDYFECHEILEEYWKEDRNKQKNSIWVGFILLAVANYHHRRNNFSGATKTLEKAITIFHFRKKEIKELGFIEDEFFNLLQHHLLMLRGYKQYESYSLPITVNTELLSQFFSNSEISNMDWGKESNLHDESLIQRHILRDRSNVIKERQIAQMERNKKKPNDGPR